MCGSSFTDSSINMQFKTLFAAILVAATGASAATVEWFEGADCTGKRIATSPHAETVSCIWLTNQGSARSIRYIDVPHQIQFFESGGQHDRCTNGFQHSAKGSGCSTAPTGKNWESVRVK
ncbi:Membrane metallo-endopeptidase-like 1 [Mycena kentingensis (nom. inval.)]|nr:Membrane metallo-endopeptidase-like 1 [Mycena kentingensis (nom. inval.)]